MPLMDYTPAWTQDQLDADIKKVYAETKDWGETASRLNNMGWSMKDGTVSRYIDANWKELSKAWRTKYAKFFTLSKTGIMVAVAAAIAIGITFWPRKK